MGRTEPPAAWTRTCVSATLARQTPSHLLFEAGVKELPANPRAPGALEASRPGSGTEPVCLSSTWLPGAAPLHTPVTL